MCPVLVLQQTLEKIKDKTEPRVESVDPSAAADLLALSTWTQRAGSGEAVLSTPRTHL